jgi:porin
MAAGINGGLSDGDGSAYAHEVTFDVVGDLKKLLGWSGGELNVRIINRVGDDYGIDDVGATIQTQEIVGGDRDVRLLYLTLSQNLFGGRVNVQGGRTAMTGRFAASPLYCTFQTLAVCGQPNALVLNGGWQVYPAQAWGGRIRAELADRVTLKAGAYEFNFANFERSGFEFRSEGQTGTTYPAELTYRTGEDAAGLPGRYHLGYLYDTSDSDDLARDPAGELYRLSGENPLRYDNREQVWATFEQMVHRTGEGRLAGVTAFGGLVLGQGDRMPVETYAFGGLSARGLVPCRPNDDVGLVVAHLDFSDAAADADRSAITSGGDVLVVRDRETVVEAHYGWQATPWLRATPNVQFIARPGGTGTIPDAWVAGLKLAVSL